MPDVEMEARPSAAGELGLHAFSELGRIPCSGPPLVVVHEHGGLQLIDLEKGKGAHESSSSRPGARSCVPLPELGGD
ncbi:hypothetical protein Dimus_033292 [Dionaea muscipula]